MRVGISGITGLVGSALARSLRRDDQEVVGFARNPDQVGDRAHEARPADWAHADLSGLDALVHLAGEPVMGPWTRAKKDRIRSSRGAATRALVDRIEALPPASRPRVLVCASAVGYYGDRRNELLTEESGPGEGFLAEVCREWEAAAAGAERLGLRVVRARIGVVLAAEGGPAQVLGTVFRTGLGGPLGDGKQWVSWIDLEDTVNALRFLLEEPGARGAVNVVSPRPVRNREMAALLGSLLRRPACLPVPAFALRFLLRGLSEMLLFSQQVVPAKLRDAGFTWRRASMRESLAQALGVGGERR
jgi:uncharacterized protein (TIGR01777 family)